MYIPWTVMIMIPNEWTGKVQPSSSNGWTCLAGPNSSWKTGRLPSPEACPMSENWLNGIHLPVSFWTGNLWPERRWTDPAWLQCSTPLSRSDTKAMPNSAWTTWPKSWFAMVSFLAVRSSFRTLRASSCRERLGSQLVTKQTTFPGRRGELCRLFAE